jgi:predicted N-acetyltransferase YhbS
MSGRMPLIIRKLAHEEVNLVWQIDRREIIENIYYLVDGKLLLKPEYYDMQGWPPGEPEQYTPILLGCFDRGGTFYGAWEDSRMVGVVILESRLIGKNRDQLQLKFLHVSSEYRNKGLGKILFEQAVKEARELGARKLYISATPSENTINFYLHLGCQVTREVDPELFELEPEDIHLEYALYS